MRLGVPKPLRAASTVRVASSLRTADRRLLPPRAASSLRTVDRVATRARQQIADQRAGVLEQVEKVRCVPTFVDGLPPVLLSPTDDSTARSVSGSPCCCVRLFTVEEALATARQLHPLPAGSSPKLTKNILDAFRAAFSAITPFITVPERVANIWYESMKSLVGSGLEQSERRRPLDRKTHGLVNTDSQRSKFEQSFAQWFGTAESGGAKSMAQLDGITDFVPLCLAHGIAEEPKCMGYYTQAYVDGKWKHCSVTVGQVPNAVSARQLARLIARVTKKEVVRVDNVSCGVFKVWFKTDDDVEEAVKLDQTCMMTQFGLLVGDAATPEATRERLLFMRILVDMYVQAVLPWKKETDPLAKHIWETHLAKENTREAVVRRVLGEMPITIERVTKHAERLFDDHRAQFCKVESLG